MEKLSLSDFENIVAAITKNVEYYERVLEPNRYFFSLANGDRLNISIPKDKIGHLLGVKAEKIKASGIVRMDISVYELVQKLINSELTYQGLKNKLFQPEYLFSEHIAKKLEIFIDIIKIRTDDLVCIVKYYADRTYTISEQKENVDYFIIRKHDGGTYSALGLLKDSRDVRRYIPVTSRLFSNREELNDFLSTLKNQEITYPSTFSVENYQQEYQKTFYSTLESKLKWCKEIKNLAFNYDLIPVNNSDVMFIIEKFMNSNRDNNNSISILNTIIDSIKSGSIIDKQYLVESLGIKYLTEELSDLIDAVNDYLYSNSSTSVSPEYSFTELTNQLNQLQKANSDCKEELNLTKEQLRQANEEIERLKEKLSLAEKCLDIYADASARVYALREGSKGLSTL